MSNGTPRNGAAKVEKLLLPPVQDQGQAASPTQAVGGTQTLCPLPRRRPAPPVGLTTDMTSVLPELQVVYRKPAQLRPADRNAKTHSKKQVRQIAASIREFGFVNPVLLDSEGRIVAGHGRVEAANHLKMAEIPTITIGNLSKEQIRAYALADNRLAELGDWDRELLALELTELSALDLNFDIEITGFNTLEIERICYPEPIAANDNPDGDEIPALAEKSVSRSGDLWLLGEHRLLCADARDLAAFERLMEGDKARMVFTDPPYNVPINGHVSGMGKVRHREFPMGTGEMSPDQFTAFLAAILSNGALVSMDGSIHFVCMDWRHMGELLAAGRQAQFELKNLCVWNKDNAGMGSFYRSKHELVFVFKHGQAEHINSFGLGDSGRYRTNVWDYPGVNTMKKGRDEELAMHPTVKPVAMVMDAIKDCSLTGDIILDAFGGSGTTVIAAEKTKRKARLIEMDPLHVDNTIRRWQKLTGGKAVRAEDGRSFDEVETGN